MTLRMTEGKAARASSRRGTHWQRSESAQNVRAASTGTMVRHESWDAFRSSIETTAPRGRLVLLSSQAETRYTDFAFHADDILLLGRESAGAPPQVHGAADARISIPMREGLRSLNIAVAAAMVLGEALRQTCGFAGT